MADKLRVFALIETTVGTSRDVAEKIRALTHVVQVDPVTGPYDLIAVIEGPNLTEVTDIVRDEIHDIDGIARTTTCISVNGKPSGVAASA